MKKHDLSTLLEKQFLDKLFGFCYSRTSNHYEAEDLSSEIVLEIIMQSKTNGDIDNPETYVWKIARNVYARYSEKRKLERIHAYEGDSEDVLINAVDEEYDDSEDKNLKKVFRAISFLSRSFRDVMVSFYFDGKSTSAIAKELSIKETTVRQRLFSARNEIRDEVNTMDTINKPTQLKHIEYLNKNVTLNDILWSQIHNLGHIFNRKVKSILCQLLGD